MTNPEIDREDHTIPSKSGTPSFAVASDPSYARTLFVGPDGLRPGWGIVFYFVTFFILQRILLGLVSLHDFGASGLWTGLLDELGNFLAAVVPAIVLAQVERRPWKSYGLPLRDILGLRFWTGAVWGFAAISLLVFVLYGLRAFSYGHVELRAARVFRFSIFWAAMFLLVGLFEEFWLRGYTLFTLARGIRFWPAALSLSIAFGLIHLRNEGEHWPGLLAAAFIGLFFCLTLQRTGNLWFAVGFHAAWDWGETFLYSVPDSGLVAPGHLLSSSLRGPDWLSGGSTGPEGSVVCFGVIALCWGLFAWRYPRSEREAQRG